MGGSDTKSKKKVVGDHSGYELVYFPDREEGKNGDSSKRPNSLKKKVAGDYSGYQLVYSPQESNSSGDHSMKQPVGNLAGYHGLPPFTKKESCSNMKGKDNPADHDAYGSTDTSSKR